MLTHTCTYSVVQWLRAEGAEWPEVLQFMDSPWPETSVAWCRSEGCDSPLKLDVEVADAEPDAEADTTTTVVDSGSTAASLYARAVAVTAAVC
jgi:hypothetical protein